MNTEVSRITVSGIDVDIVRKDIKNLHVGVYPPHGRVRVAAPRRIDDEAVRLAVVRRLRWIRRRVNEFERQSRQSPREMVTGECHYYLGRRYRLRVIEEVGTERISLRGKTWIEMYVRPGSTAENRARMLTEWYRSELKRLIPPLIERWSHLMEVEVLDCRIRRMKTKWGSCNPDSRRVTLNLELSKKPSRCLEYVVVHELAHLRTRTHDARFVSIMDAFLPDWRSLRDELNECPLAHEAWRE